MARGQAKLEDKHSVLKDAKYKKLIEAAQQLSEPLFGKGKESLQWWNELFDAFGVDDKRAAYKKVRSVIAAKLGQDSVSDDINRDSVTIDEGMGSKLSNAIDMLSREKRYQLSKRYKLASGNRRGAVLVINMLLDHGLRVGRRSQKPPQQQQPQQPQQQQQKPQKNLPSAREVFLAASPSSGHPDRLSKRQWNKLLDTIKTIHGGSAAISHADAVKLVNVARNKY